MNGYVVDASVAVKWVVEEEGTAEALTVLGNARLFAPDLLVAECANILWKKARRNELSRDEATVGARLLEQAEVEFLPTRHLLGSATALALELDHPAYDCLYLALSLERNSRFVTADKHFKRKVLERRSEQFSDMVLSLAEAAELAKE